VAGRALTEAQWGQMASPCAPLAAVLPAVLARSRLEARLLVQHLEPGQRQRLRTLALCLARAQQTAGAPLPPALTAGCWARRGVC
jgi:hypothetical protein